MLRDESFRSIQGKLAGLKQMERICSAWDLIGEIKLGDHAFNAQALIVHQMKNPIAARFIWQRLGRTAQRFLYALLTDNNPGKGVPIARIQRQLKITNEEAETIVEQMKALFLLEEDTLPGRQPTRVRGMELLTPTPVRALFLYRECAESLFDTGQELFLAYDNREKQPLVQLLRSMRRDRLEHLARLCHVTARSVISIYSDDVSSIYSQDKYLAIAEALGQAPIFFEIFRALEPNVQAFFLWLCQKDGRVTMSEAQAYLTAQECTRRSFYFLFETLEAHALVFDTLQSGGERVVFIHQQLLSGLKEDIHQYVLDEQQHALLPVHTEPLEVEEGLPYVLYDLAICIGWVYQQTLEKTREGKLPKKWQAKIRPMLHGRPRLKDNDDLYLDLLFSTAKELDLLRYMAQEEGKPGYHPTRFLAHWQQMSTVEQTRRFLTWWEKSSTWYDVRIDGNIILMLDRNTVEARKNLLLHLTTCSPGKWYHISSLLFSIWKHIPLSAAEHSREHTPEQLSLRERRTRWMERGEGQIYLSLLLSSLREMGIINFGYDQAGSQTGIPDFFQLTTLGAGVLIEDADHSSLSLFSEEQKRIIVQPNFEILVFHFESDLIYRLIQFAAIKAVNRVSSFVLTQASLLRGLEAGNRLEEVLSFLMDASKLSLPQNITYSLHDWAKGYKEARVSSVLLIELLPDKYEGDLYRILEDLNIEARQLAPGIFVLAVDALPFSTLRERMEKEGIIIKRVIQDEV